MTIEELIPDESAVLELCGSRREDVLAQLAAGLARRTKLAPELLLDSLREREALGSTAIGCGLAIPHAKIEVAQPYGLLALAREGVDFGAPDGAPVHIFLALASPPQPNEHLRALACVSRVFSEPTMLDQLLACPDTTAILAVLHGRTIATST